MKCTSYLDVFNTENDLESINYSIIDLLPQNHLAVVRDTKMLLEILRLSYSSIALLIDCLYKFYVDEQYKYFDPHIGENACQIRAYMFISLSKEKYDKNIFDERINFLKLKLDRIKNIINTQVNYRNNSFTIYQLIKKYSFYFSLSWQEVFLCKSYALTIFKKSHSHDTYVCNEDVSKFFLISKKVSKKLIHKYQLHISALSCKFIQNIATDININKYNHPNLVSSLQYDDDGRMVYPCFFYSTIVFLHMKKSLINILVILESVDSKKNVMTDFIFFENGSKCGYLITQSNINTLRHNTCMVITCSRKEIDPITSSELLEKLNFFGIYHILLMNMSAHPQYSGAKLAPLTQQLVSDDVELVSSEKEMNNEFMRFKQIAKTRGFCRDNSSLLLVKHIFIDIVNNQVSFNTKNKKKLNEIDIVNV